MRVGLQYSDYIHVDDSGARHQGNNGYVTHIGNEAFACFSTTFSKSRIHFLQPLHGGVPHYTDNSFAQDYYRTQGLPQGPSSRLQQSCPSRLDEPQWERTWAALGWITNAIGVSPAKGALLGGLIEQGFNSKLIIVSDGAGQFAMLVHALCWVHAERWVHKLIGLNDPHREDIAKVHGEIWTLYAELKRFADNPQPALAEPLQTRFDTIFTQTTSCHMLNQWLKRLHKRKHELLLILKHPTIPLHNNLSEGTFASLWGSEK